MRASSLHFKKLYKNLNGTQHVGLVYSNFWIIFVIIQHRKTTTVTDVCKKFVYCDIFLVFFFCRWCFLGFSVDFYNIFTLLGRFLSIGCYSKYCLMLPDWFDFLRLKFMIWSGFINFRIDFFNTEITNLSRGWIFIEIIFCLHSFFLVAIKFLIKEYFVVSLFFVWYTVFFT